MALTQDTLKYLKFLPLLQELPKRQFMLLYDSEADVLYIDFFNPPRPCEDTELTDDDIVIRYDQFDEVVGLTVLHASSR
ncbi:MAG: DUF2283 domain-containing protein [Phormidium sp. GEM2.Bin31]|nr:MAG: DUF2283 domain-containing protein [Phormidium sp. GEM2.Bin31]